MTVNGRAALVRQLQAFFEMKMLGLFSWRTVGEEDEDAPEGTIRLRAPERHPKIPGKRQLDKDVVAVDFGGYALSVHAPSEAPPLGKIVVFHPELGSIEGPLDEVTWGRVEKFIKERQMQCL